MPDREETLAEKLADPFRMCCPEGHTNLEGAETTPTAYCKGCGVAYHADELIDKREEPGRLRDGDGARNGR